ncbi:hypothetical protein LCGC14_1879500 [marine sediment metagenome]|uniref:Uncharacterized protein n=1 Tax=marine sediment metagenome TaxID=412755 RepID=A0A0F9J173_9ZZZZ
MKEELLNQIKPILEMTKNGIIKAAEVIQQQAPEVVAEIYRWEFFKSLFGFIVGMLLLVLAIYGPCRFYRFLKNEDSVTDGDTIGISLMVLSFSLIVPVVVLGCNLTWIKIYIAPKLFLISYLSDLIK